MPSATFPVRCRTCNKVIAHIQEKYEEKLEAKMKTTDGSDASIQGAVLDELRIARPCCRIEFITHYPWDEMARMYKECCATMSPWKLFSDDKVTHIAAPSIATAAAAAAAAAPTIATTTTTNNNANANSGGDASATQAAMGAAWRPRQGARCYIAQ